MIPERTFADWDDAQPGSTEVDLVAHCGDSTRGEDLDSLNMVDVKIRWTEFVPLLNRGQAAVVADIDQCRQRLPYALLGLDSDNGSEFINYQLKRHCEQRQITFARGRPYKKNDQAYIEQKNWMAIRQTVGDDRYEGSAAYALLGDVYQPLRLYINFFQPIMVPLYKERVRAQVKCYYHQAPDACQRVLEAPEVAAEAKERLRRRYLTLNRRRRCGGSSASWPSFGDWPTSTQPHLWDSRGSLTCRAPRFPGIPPADTGARLP